MIVFLSLVGFIQVFAADHILYGEDNRVDIFKSKNLTVMKQSKAVAAQVSDFHLQENDEGDYSLLPGFLLSTPIGTNVCTDEKYAMQPTVSSCTGFLVAEDLLVTAGHCVTSKDEVKDVQTEDCKNGKWLFDYYAFNNNVSAKSVSKDRIYKCEKVVHASTKDGADFAIIKLDRKVKGRTPLTMSEHKSLASDEVYAIGTPSGLPLKMTDHAFIKSIDKDGSLHTNLDTFGGNSGSPIFDKVSGEVVGILVKGEADYHPDFGKNGQVCMRPNRCDEKGENCSIDKKFYVQVLLEFIQSDEVFPHYKAAEVVSFDVSGNLIHLELSGGELLEQKNYKIRFEERERPDYPSEVGTSIQKVLKLIRPTPPLA